MMQDYILSIYSLYGRANPYLTPIRHFFSTVQTRLSPLLIPLLDKLAVLAQDSPAIVSVGVLLLFLVIALQVLDFARRVMMFWTRLVMRVTFWAGVVLLLAAVWQRGVGRTAEDALGWGRELNEVWWREYRKWEGFQNQRKVTATSGRAGWR